VDQLKESGLLEKTLVIITADHGEMLGGKGSALGHGWAVTPELTNVPLIIMDPDKPGYRINDRIGSQVDLLPTVLDALGVAIPNEELYQGRSLYATKEETNRLIYLNSFQQYGVIAGRQFVSGDRGSDERGAADFKKTAYVISNDGAKTVFTEDTTATNRAISIRQFDQLQESLLRNYSHYRESIGKGRAGDPHYARP
jgi:arylsulfatase A-like enzyme